MATTMVEIPDALSMGKDSQATITVDNICQLNNGKDFLQLSPVIRGSTEKPISAKRNGERGYYRNEELGGPIHSEREMKIIVIGAGASALCFAYKLQRSFDTFSLKLYEKNPEISGTWYENRYPG